MGFGRRILSECAPGQNILLLFVLGRGNGCLHEWLVLGLLERWRMDGWMGC